MHEYDIMYPRGVAFTFMLLHKFTVLPKVTLLLGIAK